MKFNLMDQNTESRVDEINEFLSTNSSEIMQPFKKFFFDHLGRGEETSFSKLIDKTLHDFGVFQKELHHPIVSEIMAWHNSFLSLSYLKSLLQNSFEEIIIHSPYSQQIFSQNDIQDNTQSFITNEYYEDFLSFISLKFKQKWNYSTPFCSFNAEINSYNYRFTLIHNSTLEDTYSKLFIRKISPDVFPLENYARDQQQLLQLKEIIHGKSNVLIAGATCSGKTSFLGSMLSLVDPDEHIVVMEDTYEIMTTNPHHTHFVSGDEENKSLKDYCAYALRMRPDRMVLGEMRSSEVIPFLLAMNTGHKGLMSTIHANSAVDTISRLGTLFQLYSGQTQMKDQVIQEMVCQAIDDIIFLENKKITEWIKVIGYADGNPIFKRMDLMNNIDFKIAESVAF